MKNQWDTKSAFARLIKKDVSYVSKQLKKANLKTKNGKIHLGQAKAWWDSHIQTKHAPRKYRDKEHDGRTISQGNGSGSQNSGAIGTPGLDASGLSFNDRRDKAVAELKELEVAKLKGELLNKAKVIKTVFQIGRQARDLFSAIPRRVSGTLATETDQRTIQVLLEQEIEKGLRVFEEVKL